MSTTSLNPLVDKIRAAHPGAYDDLSDAELTAKVVSKYPQYGDLAVPYSKSVPAGLQPDKPTAMVPLPGQQPIQMSGTPPLQTAIGQMKGGNVAGGLHTLISKSGEALSPLAVPAIAAAPVASVLGAGGAMAGNYGGRAIAEHFGASPDVTNLAGDVGGIAGGAAGGAAGSKIQSMIPSAKNAGAALQDVRATAGKIPIDTSKVGDSALDLYEQSQRGATLPKAVRQLVVRMTSPDAEPLTYEEAKDFQSNISRLSANERMNLNANTKRLVGQLNVSLKGSLEDAADTVGKGEQFTQAMKEYHNAMQIKGLSDEAKAAALKAALVAGFGGLGALGFYGAKKFFPELVGQ